MSFNDNMIRRSDLPADAMALIHDIAYHHQQRDVTTYVRAARKILKRKASPQNVPGYSERKRKASTAGLMYPKPVRLKGKNIRRADCDEAEKQKRGYTNPRSIVRHDGSEILFKEDWRARVQELRVRSGGVCEEIVPFTSGNRCWKAAADPHHKMKRSVRRDDRLSNLKDLCREHHDLLDPRKPRWSKKEQDNG